MVITEEMVVHNIEVGAAVTAHELRLFKGCFPPRMEGPGVVDASAFDCGLAAVEPAGSTVDAIRSLASRSGVLA